ncbi:MAG TPA: aminotransferase class V-fold PLP-dependent enzyme [Gemmataceae bacterium]|nr:aminotransferase class V-fold PLP-dependent enzyme [Gemmataceae bacterium]
MIYLDNAATSWPKPAVVAQAIGQFLETSAANPGRSGHRLSLAAARVVYNLREALAEFFGLEDPLRLVFTSGVTESVNLALRGLLRPGDHVVTSPIEHNAVMRPLRALEREGVRLTIVPGTANGCLRLGDLELSLRPETRLVVLNHASNVSGTILPVAEVGAITRRQGKLLLVDAAQTAGVLPIDMKAMNVDLLAFSGHKGLLGPTGTGGLAIGERVDVRDMAPLKRGGTGSRSEFEEQPDFLPDKYEAGTPNSVGLAGLAASLDFLRQRGTEALRRHEMTLTGQLLEGLRAISGVRVFGPCDPARQVAVVSFTLTGRHVSDIALQLDEEHGVLCRPGLHCAPAAHRTLGSFPEGTVRFSPGAFTTAKEVEAALAAVARLARAPT